MRDYASLIFEQPAAYIKPSYFTLCYMGIIGIVQLDHILLMIAGPGIIYA